MTLQKYKTVTDAILLQARSMVRSKFYTLTIIGTEKCRCYTGIAELSLGINTNDTPAELARFIHREQAGISLYENT